MNVSTLMSSRPVRVDCRASLDHAMDLMDERDVRHLVVLDGDELVGVLSDRNLLDATGWLHPRQREVLEAPQGTVGAFMSSPALVVQAEDDLGDALGVLLEHRIGCLPVVHEGELRGLLSEMDVLRGFADARRAGRVAPQDDPPIERRMTRGPLTVAGDASGDEAAGLMRESGYRHLPVVSGEELVGILSDRDVCRARGRGQLEVSLVREIMSPEPQIARVDEPLSSAALILADSRISALPVVDGRRLVGIVTMADVLRACAAVLRRVD